MSDEKFLPILNFDSREEYCLTSDYNVLSNSSAFLNGDRLKPYGNGRLTAESVETSCTVMPDIWDTEKIQFEVDQRDQFIIDSVRYQEDAAIYARMSGSYTHHYMWIMSGCKRRGKCLPYMRQQLVDVHHLIVETDKSGNIVESLWGHNGNPPKSIGMYESDDGRFHLYFKKNTHELTTPFSLGIVCMPMIQHVSRKSKWLQICPFATG